MPARAPYAAAVLALASVRAPVRVVIVGANDGRINDPIHATLTGPLRAASAVLLVEPQPALADVLRETFAGHPAARVVTGAVGAPGPLTLHAVRRQYWDRLAVPYAADWPVWRAPTGVTSADRAHVEAWAAAHGPAGVAPGEMVEAFETEARPLPQILAEAGWPPRIDVLQVDVEGMEDDVLGHSALDETRPAVVMAEIAHLGASRLARLESLLAGDYTVAARGADLLAIRSPGSGARNQARS